MREEGLWVIADEWHPSGIFYGSDAGVVTVPLGDLRQFRMGDRGVQKVTAGCD